MRTSSHLPFKGAWLPSPFSAAPAAGRALVLREVLIVLGAVGLGKEGWIYRASAWGRVGSLLPLHPGLCPGCTLPGELRQHPSSSALARLGYKRLISHDCAHLQITRYLWAMGWGAQHYRLGAYPRHSREHGRDPGGTRGNPAAVAHACTSSGLQMPELPWALVNKTRHFAQVCLHLSTEKSFPRSLVQGKNTVSFVWQLAPAVTTAVRRAI